MKKRGMRWCLILTYMLVLSTTVMLTIVGNRSITVIAEQVPVSNRKVVIIDAGHGGIDGGASSPTGILESQINLQIARKLDDLMHLLGIKTVMIRTTDTSIHIKGNTIAQKKVSDLNERVRIVNETEGSILVSIHQNHFSDSRYSGAQAFYAPTDGSKELAEKIQRTFAQSIDPTNKRQVKKTDGVYLMQHIQRTGVLIECGFLSNPKEEVLLQNAQYQNKICCVIASCCSTFLQEDTQLT